jgi:error-prone DNA polymerase
MKMHYPSAMLAGLLDGQPMGFWSPQTLVADSRRHGVVVRPPDVNASVAKSLLESCEESAGGAAVRLGIEYVRHIGEDLAKRIAEGRPYKSMEDVSRRCGLTQPQVEALATAGAFGCFDVERRSALWSAGAVVQARPDRLPGIVTGEVAPTLPGMTPVEENRADLWATSLSATSYPTEFIRAELDGLGVVPSAGLPGVEADSRVLVAGVVTHRQRPATAGGTIFLNLEDETGLINVIVGYGVWLRYRRVARSAPALLIRGQLEKVEGVIIVVADRITALDLQATTIKSRDFR